MVRFTTLLITAALVPSGPSVARGQDSDEVKRLKEKIEFLEAKLEAATLKIAKLEAELKKKPPIEPKRKLSDILTEGTTIRGDFRFVVGNNNAVGDWSLTIKERNGKAFTGAYTATDKNHQGPVREHEAKGEIDGDTIRFKIDNSYIRATATGTMKQDNSLELNWDGRAGKAKLKATIAK